MKGYEVQMMDDVSYNNYMSGGWHYHLETVEVIAETPEKAIEKAKYLYPDMVINEYVEECEITTPVEDQMTLADLL